MTTIVFKRKQYWAYLTMDIKQWARNDMYIVKYMCVHVQCISDPNLKGTPLVITRLQID